ncbi:helix-turn-helix domain-containing protein [Psychromonas ossibalaenae]|uniref:helix-turn-helix domain-containing protein n=1 Tax=Psychromonas ossibalaenae TaxID=444922 RepID=UPI000369DD9D
MIKQLRLENGWSQEQLAEFSGLSVRTIQRIERGQNAGLESLKCIAASLLVPVSRLQKHNEQVNELFLGATPILPVNSVVDTARFYQQQLGFDIETLWKDPPYGVVARGMAVIEFGEGRKQSAGTGVCLLFVADVDAVYQEYQDKKIEFVGDISDRDYGCRDFRVKDNNGNILIISSPLINQKALLAAGNHL